MYWWVALGYPDAFEEGKGGFPRTGQVIKYYRERTMDHEGFPYTQKDLAKVLGITDHTVRELENKDLGIDHDRRQFLSKLFNIPPILLGIFTIEQVNRMLESEGKGFAVSLAPAGPSHALTRSNSTLVTRKESIDPKEYDKLIVSLWDTNNIGTAYGSIADTLLTIDAFYRELPHVIDEERPHLQELLCNYHQFVANLFRDQEKFNTAISHLDKALYFANVLNKDELKALVLHRRGITWQEAGFFDKAIKDYQDARQYEKGLPSNLNGVILLGASLSGAKGAQTQEAQDAAILLCDRVGNIIRNNQKEEDPYSLKLDLNRYHLDKSAALIAVGRNKDALRELKLVRSGPKQLRRQAYHGVLEAQAYANLGKYERAGELAEFALLIAQQIDSKVNIARVVRIYQQLLESSYKRSPDVARLDYLLYYKPRAQ